jgi:hypothetical protein
MNVQYKFVQQGLGGSRICINTKNTIMLVMSSFFLKPCSRCGCTFEAGRRQEQLDRNESTGTTLSMCDGFIYVTRLVLALLMSPTVPRWSHLQLFGTSPCFFLFRPLWLFALSYLLARSQLSALSFHTPSIDCRSVQCSVQSGSEPRLSPHVQSEALQARHGAFVDRATALRSRLAPCLCLGTILRPVVVHLALIGRKSTEECGSVQRLRLQSRCVIPAAFAQPYTTAWTQCVGLGSTNSS